MQFPPSAAASRGGDDVIRLQDHRERPVTDERDEFISWMRSEFAAANAIIDALCQHLLAMGGVPREYDAALGAIRQRRLYWAPVLYKQLHFSIAEVAQALEQVALRKENRHHQLHHHHHRFDHHGKNYLLGIKQGQQSDTMKASQSSNGSGDVGKVEDESSEVIEVQKDDIANPNSETNLKTSRDSEASAVGNAETNFKAVNGKCTSSSEDKNSHACQTQDGKQNLAITPKAFVASEIYHGKMVNVVDGLSLYEELFDENEVSKLVLMVNDLRAAGKTGQLAGTGQTYTVLERPMRGHGRVVIQLGLPIADAPVDNEHPAALSMDGKVESIPSALQEVINRLFDMQITSLKPDSCIIDVYNEGDYSQPHLYPSWFGRPVCTLFLSECDMTFGRIIVYDRPGDYKGSIKLSFSPGSLAVMQGKSADLSKHAIDSIRKHRILVTFTKSQRGKPTPSDAMSSHFGPPRSWSPNHTRHFVGPKHNSSLAQPPNHFQAPPPNGIQPLLMPALVTPAMSFRSLVLGPPPGMIGLQAPWFPLPGTGVFLPPRSGNLPFRPPQSSTTDEMNSATGHGSFQQKKIVSAESNHDICISPGAPSDDKKLERKDCNGSSNGSNGGDAAVKEHQSGDSAK